MCVYLSIYYYYYYYYFFDVACLLCYPASPNKMSRLYNVSKLIEKIKIEKSLCQKLSTTKKNPKNQYNLNLISKKGYDNVLSNFTCVQQVFLCHKLIEKLSIIDTSWKYHQRNDKKYRKNNINKNYFNFGYLISGLGLGVVFCDASGFTKGN